MKKILASIVMLIATAVSAQNITAIVTLPPGSGVDVNARLIMKRYDELHGTVTTFINKPGADGNVGIRAYHELQTNDTKILFASTGHIIGLAPSEFEKWTAISPLTRQPFALMVKKDFPANDWKEFIEYARKNPKKVNNGVVAPAMMGPLLVEFEGRHQYQTNWILYLGNSRPELDVANGNLDSMWTPAALALNSGVSDRVKVIAITGTEQVVGAEPSTIKGNELGLMYLTQGVYASSMDDSTRQILTKRFDEILKSPWAKENLETKGIYPVGGTGRTFNQFLKTHHTAWQRIKSDVVKQQ